ncbi:MAG: thioredoxin family protein [Dehalococcoidia bacterium]|nr:thioredoxin family protein [Dehalococcoidia bacterium]
MIVVTTAAQVVTPERFAKGLTWQEYVAGDIKSKEMFLKNYEELQIDPSDVEFFKKFVSKKGEVHVVALGEDWCPDVVRGLPVVAKIAHSCGMDFKVFPRDVNLDIMELYLWRREHQSIPVFVFFNAEFKELGTWIERPAAAYKFMAEVTEQLQAMNLSEEESRTESRKRRQDAQELWKKETVREIKELLYRVM